MLDLDTKVKLFKEYLDNGGYEKLNSVELINGLLNVKHDGRGKVIPDTVNPLVRAALNAYVGTQLMEPFTSPQYISQYESILQKNVFFKQTTIETETELEEFILEYGNKQDFIYRGVREAKWRLYSSLQRHWIVNKYESKMISYKDFILDLVENGRNVYQKTLSNFLAKNDIDPGNDLAILSFLQHHGQPTPILDWTEELANALYFGIDGIDLTIGVREIDQYFSIYLLDASLFSEVGIKQAMEKKVKTFSGKMRKGLEQYAQHKGLPPDTFDKLFSDDIMKKMTVMRIGNRFASGLTNINLLYNLPFAFFSDALDDSLKFGMNNNLRITNQRGVFTWNSHPALPLEHVILNDAKERAKNGIEELWVCSCVNISKKLTAYISDFLRSNEITKDYIYPNPELLAEKAFVDTLRKFDLEK